MAVAVMMLVASLIFPDGCKPEIIIKYQPENLEHA